MEMGYRDHIVAKLGALAVAGGTTAMLFAASPVHTTFNAQATGLINASGSTVSQALQGNLDATQLQPGVKTNPAIWSIKNTGSVPESFSLQFGNIAGTTTNNTVSSASGLSPNTGQLSNPQLVVALQQLGYKAAAWSCPSDVSTPSTTLGCTVLRDAYHVYMPLIPANTTLSAFEQIHFPFDSYNGGSYSVSAGNYLEVRVRLELLQPPTGAQSWVANVWNGASLTIPYTITAEASASAGTSTPPSLTKPGSTSPS
jgi:hypothetical protein